MVYGIGSMVHGVWSWVYGVWCTLYATYWMVQGVWCMVQGVGEDSHTGGLTFIDFEHSGPSFRGTVPLIPGTPQDSLIVGTD